MSTGQPPLRGTGARGARQEALIGSALPLQRCSMRELKERGLLCQIREDWAGVEEQGSGTLPGQAKFDGWLPLQEFLLHCPLTCWQELPEPIRELTAKVALQDQGYTSQSFPTLFFLLQSHPWGGRGLSLLGAPRAIQGLHSLVYKLFLFAESIHFLFIAIPTPKEVHKPSLCMLHSK